MTNKYSMIIEWSDADTAYVVTLPEFPCNRTHGATYEEAAIAQRSRHQNIALCVDVFGEAGATGGVLVDEERELRHRRAHTTYTDY